MSPAAVASGPARQPVELDGALLSFAAAFVDTACFIGLFGLFTAHVTGNFVLIGAALVSGSTAIAAKLLALPVFAVAVAFTALFTVRQRSRGRRPLATALLVQTLLLALAAGASAALPVPQQGNDAAALSVGLLAVAAMGVQNALMRLELAALPPSTVMTGNVTQFVIDLVAWRSATAAPLAEQARQRLRHQMPGLVAFTAGAAAGALGYALAGLPSLALPAGLCAALAWRLRGP